MDKELLLKNGMDMLYLTACALRGLVPDTQRIEAMDLEAVYQVAKMQSMTAVSFSGLELWLRAEPEGRIPVRAEVYSRWKEGWNKAIRKNILLDVEREKLLAHMDELGCWYMPLKGVILKDMYPKLGMRQMSDNDILFDPNFREQIHDYMVKNGYYVEKYRKSNHDIYKKQPVYNFEMHIALFSELKDSRWVEYYRDVKNRLQKDDHHPLGYHFTDEDFYVYIMTHTYKHFNYSGCGVRFLGDIHVFLSAKKDSLNWMYITTELEKLGIREFEKICRSLSEKLFAQTDAVLAEDEVAVLDYCLGSGVYGNWEQFIMNRLNAQVGKKDVITMGDKVRYYLRRLFPEKKFYKEYAPFAYEHPILIPFVAVWRIIWGVLTSGKKICKEISLVWKTGNQN